jgi:hypothetical protein
LEHVAAFLVAMALMSMYRGEMIVGGWKDAEDLMSSLRLIYETTASETWGIRSGSYSSILRSSVEEPDTGILVITGLMSQFPNIGMIERVIRSLLYIEGIHPDTPV